MARKLIEAALTTRTARAALVAGLHWRAIDPDIHLGYRKARVGGKWIVRHYLAALKTYRRIELGTADDAIAEGTLSYNAAVASARDAVAKARRGSTLRFDLPVGTIRTAVEAHIAVHNARESAREGRLVRSITAGTLRRHVLDNPPFANISLEALTEEQLAAWLIGLGDRLKPTRKRRIATDLKAALNAVHRAARKKLPSDFAETVRLGLKADNLAETEQADEIVEGMILADDTVRALVSAAYRVDDDGDLGRLVICLVATGARFSQLRRMKVRDVQPALHRLMVPKSRKGGQGKKGGYTPVRVGPDVIAALASITQDRGSDEPLLCRWRHVQIGPAKWRRDSRGPWMIASEMTRPWKAACKVAGVVGTIPYALRHSSIVRGIREGLPIRLVAAVHDTSVAMIERHYARWIADGLDELAAKAIVPMMQAA
ncbi:integrase [uncultured Sphingomonas sp.]|uniref:integrase n=1 Tax=uncultured Sphingomonas sp. TaxID=158754 RepID=UPI0035CAFF24